MAEAPQRRFCLIVTRGPFPKLNVPYFPLRAVPQMERELIIERSRAGLQARPAPRTRRGSKASDDRQQGSVCKKAIGKRAAATRGGAQLSRVGPTLYRWGGGFFTDVEGLR
jgi:hypothetical protein